MEARDTQSEASRMADNLRRAIELTELGLSLRCAVLRQQNPDRDIMKQVMHEIRLAKEQAWRQSPS